MVVEVEDYGWDLSKLNLETGEEYFNKLEEFKNDGKWIYIHSIYATIETGGYSENIYGYELGDDFGKDNYVYNIVGIDSCECSCDLIISSDYYSGDMEGDYGIMIENGEISFGQYIGGFASSIDPITDLSEPLNAFAVEILLKIIEFKE